MKKITKKEAIALFKANKEVYKLYSDNSEALIEDESDFDSKDFEYGIEEFNYYRSELNKIKTNSAYAPTLQITDHEGTKTKNMCINFESKDEIIRWLNSNF